MSEFMTEMIESLATVAAGPVELEAPAVGPPLHGYWDGSSLLRVGRPDGGVLVERWSVADGTPRLDGTVERSTSGTYREQVPGDRLMPEQLWDRVPHTRPAAFGSGANRTFGTGDRLGNAGHAHAAAFRTRDARPVLCQQSVRELTLTKRNYRDISLAAAIGAIEAGLESGYGFDGDHLKSVDEVRAAYDAGASMLTLDLSGRLDMVGVHGTRDELDTAWRRLPQNVRNHWTSQYSDRHVTVGGLNLHLTDDDVRRTAVTFDDGLTFVSEVADFLRDRQARPVDIEVSVDETGVDTSAAQHFLIAAELERREKAITSLAPKFVGEFQKGVDYIGDPAALERDLKTHAAIARGMTAGYRLSLHSGSDKFTLFPLVESICAGRYHLKTAGTFWLEAARTVARTCPETFESVFSLAWETFEEMRTLYALHADRARIVPPGTRGHDEIDRYFEENDARQLLHVAYGAVLTDPELGSRFFACLNEHRGAYLEMVRAHLERHLDALAVPGR